MRLAGNSIDRITGSGLIDPTGGNHEEKEEGQEEIIEVHSSGY